MGLGALTTLDVHVPFIYFSSAISENATPEQLHMVYTALYAQALHSARQYVAMTPGSTLIHRTEQDESPISYNLGIISNAMILCPRASEGMKIKNNSGDEVGRVALNGTVLGGTLLVKNEEEWDALRDDESKLRDALRIIGIPHTKHEQDGRL